MLSLFFQNPSLSLKDIFAVALGGRARKRFETTETASRSKTDQELREELLRKLVDRHLLGPTTEILVETDIQTLPVRELPPGNTSALYMMYVAYMRTAGGEAQAASKSTFFDVAKEWRPCLRFRRKSDHTMYAECSMLKNSIAKCKEPSAFIFYFTLHVSSVCVSGMTYIMNTPLPLSKLLEYLGFPETR